MNRPLARRSLQCLTLTVGLLFPALLVQAGGWFGHKTWQAHPSEGYTVPIQQVVQFPAVTIRQPCSSLFHPVPFRYEALYPGLGGSAWYASGFGATVAPSTTIIDATLLPSVGSSIMDGSAFP
jgi:hypothetical protein